MEGEVGNPSTETYTDIFNRAFPYYLSIGMTYELYWHGEPGLVKAYREAAEMQTDRMNYEKWLQGFYVYQGVASLYPLFNPLSKKRKPEEYPKEPILITKRAIEQKEKEEGQKTANFLMAWVEALKKKGINNG